MTLKPHLTRLSGTPAVVALALFGLASVVGFATFRVWPELLARPSVVAAYPDALEFFARGQIVLAFVVLAAYLTLRVRARWLAAFTAVYVVSLASELAGTTVGLPFGPYSYTEALGAMWFAHVPVLIPFSWFMMALPSFALAGAGRGSKSRRIVMASLILLAWDLILDPAMSAATAFWVWGSDGSYYGMPWLNLFGWFVTGLALMAVMAALRVDEWLDRLPKRWMAAYYAANLVVPVGLALTAQMWLAVAATMVALVLCWIAVRDVHARAGEPVAVSS